MERQTLQQQPPVYHVCQQCGGEGCPACSDLCILEGDIELDPYECRYCGWIGGHVDGCVFVDPDLDSSPINGVIGTIPGDYSSIESRLAHMNKLAAHFPYSAKNAGLNRDVLCDGADSVPKADPVCPKCGKSRFDSAYGCLAPQVYSPAAGDWVCGKKTAAPSPKSTPKHDISFDDRNMYQRREDDLRLAGEWEV
ncbi:hypothetical protein SJU92_14735 [Aeromonas caviae]|uniref:hypothetical protein n=1 Tax=Aeromonas caviae TaxID=648 RepID=UPI0029DB7CA9|nr:hypothetical protein [Aeromonas caviae]MDX7857255.1 hypothetical protein [Aeromonas caviae]